MKLLHFFFGLILIGIACRADVEISVFSAELSGGKATVNLALTNTFTQPVKEARAWVFLLDAEGKVMANKAQWLVGGKDQPASWEAGEIKRCAVTLDVPRPVAATRVMFSRLTLADGTEANPQKQIKTPPPAP